MSDYAWTLLGRICEAVANEKNPLGIVGRSPQVVLVGPADDCDGWTAGIRIYSTEPDVVFKWHVSITADEPQEAVYRLAAILGVG